MNTDEVILEAKRFIQQHKPPPELTAAARLAAKKRIATERMLKEKGHIPKDAILVEDAPGFKPKSGGRGGERRDLPRGRTL